MDKVILELQAELKKLSSDPKNLKDYSRFEKDKTPILSLPTPVIRAISSKYFKEVRKKSKEEIFDLCNQILKENKMGGRQIAFDWAFRVRKEYSKEDFKLFQSWLETYVDGWGSCDDFCNHAFGEFIYQFPLFHADLERWARSRNQWMRRASAVVLIYSVRKGKTLKQIFKISDMLMKDPEDLVQKGYGWTLKEATKHFENEVFAYVMKNKKEMSRTALRYAIEKMPEKLRQEALS